MGYSIACVTRGCQPYLLPAGLPEGTRQMLELLHGAANQLMAGVPAGKIV
jgi:hypothetical protein